MPITFDEGRGIFKLDTEKSTYAMMVGEGGFLIHLYYGARLPDDDLRYLARRGWFDSLSPHPADVGDPLFSPDVCPMEYSANGAGDFRLSALSIRNGDGNTVTDPRYEGHRVIPGKPGLPGLPASFAGEGEAETLEIAMRDPATGARVFLLYTVFAGTDVMARSVRIENGGEAPIQLERVFSACLDLPWADREMVHLYGKWAKENTAVRQPLRPGVQGYGSKRGMTSHNHNPFLALPRRDATEDTGDVIGMNLVYSGNFAVEVEVDARGCPRVLMGINPEDFLWTLAPGESFTAPEALTVWSGNGLGGMSRAFHRFIPAHLTRGEWARKKRPLLINSWEAAFFDFDGDKLVEFAKEAKELGIELLVMDDGWFGDRRDDHRALGDWTVNEEKLGGPLSDLIRRVNGLGVEFGIWYEPEMISPDSDLYRAHPDWAIGAPGRGRSLARHQCVLDMTRPDVREYLFERMSAVLSENNITYVKWDCNRNITEAASAALPPERQGEFFHRYALGVYDLMDRITTAFPHILLENCSAGGGRFDLGMLYYAPQIWTSDNTDPIERLTIQFGASLGYPASAMGAHVSANPRTGIETRGAVALWGTFGYELDPRLLTAEEREIVKAQVAEYHRTYDLVHSGDLYRITSPGENPFFCDWGFVSPDKNQALFTRVYFRRPDSPYQLQRLRGLDPEKRYRDEDTGEVYSGALLLEAGVFMTPPDTPLPEDGSSVVKRFTAC